MNLSLNAANALLHSLIPMGALLLLGTHIFLCLRLTRLSRRRYLLTMMLITLVWLFFTVILMDGIFPAAEWYDARNYPWFVEAVYELPWPLIAGLECLSGAVITGMIINTENYRKTNLTEGAVKEAVDYLPMGVCLCEPDGRIVLSNLKIRGDFRKMTGQPLVSGSQLRELMEDAREEGGQQIIRMDDGSTFLLSEEAIEVDGLPYGQFKVVDVTEQARLTSELEGKNVKLREIQCRMKAYQVRAADMYMDQEMLAARVAVHDGLGSLLLHCRYYFEHPESVDEGELLKMMKQTNQYLLREIEDPEISRDEMDDALRLADGIGVQVEIDGSIPDNETARTLLANVIRECAANTVKHAGGDMLRISVADRGIRNGANTGSPDAENGYRMICTNNGLPPENPIQETGGLYLLRCMTEEAGGTISIQGQPEFVLTIDLPYETKRPV